MKVKVNQDKCIGCGACPIIAPEVFELNDDGLAQVKVDERADFNEEDILNAAESCPTEAIDVEK